MITGPGRVCVLSGVRVSRLTAALGRAHGRESWAGAGYAGGGGEGRPAGPPVVFGPLG
jgi:hypothetical protein